MSNMRFTLAAAIVTSLATLGVARAADDTIRIGLLLPYKGVYAPLAEDIDKAWQVALDEFGGEIGGKKIVLYRADDELNPQVGIQRFNKLVDSDGVQLVAGVIGSSVAVSLTSVAEKRKVPIVFAMAFGDEITGRFCNPYVARTSFSARAYEYGSGAYWAKHSKSAVTLGPDYVAGRDFLEAFKAGYEANGGIVVEQIWTSFQKTKDWSTPLAKAKTMAPDMIYSFYGGAEAIQVVKQHAEFGLKSQVPLNGGIFLYDETLWGAMGDAVLGAKVVTLFYAENEAKASREFVERYVAKHKQKPTVNAALGYDNARSVLLALKNLSGSFADGKDFIDAIRKLSFDSPRGKMSFNNANNAKIEKLYLVEVVQKDGQLGHRYVDSLPGGEDFPGCKM